MDTENLPQPVQSPSAAYPNNIVEGHRACQTNVIKWLSIEEIYQKLHRPNIYDIGGTYNASVLDFWFTFKTEQEHDLFLLHLFIGNHTEGTYILDVSSGGIPLYYQDNIVRLSDDVDTFKVDCKEHANQSYVTTYTFTEADMEHLLKDKKLYIAIHFPGSEKPESGDGNHTYNGVAYHHDYMTLLKNPVGSDFVIESADGVEFPVHREVLCAHSEVFKAMLKEDMVENKEGRVKLIDVASDDLKAMLTYMYTCNIPDLETEISNVPNVIMLADRYNLKGLQKLCSCVLINQLCPENAIDVLVIADMSNYSEARQQVLQYLKQNKELFTGMKFDDIDNKALLKDLCALVFS